MSDLQGPGDGRVNELGEPIIELGLLRESPAAGFLQRVRNSIQRRMSASEAIDFSLMALFQTFWEYLARAIQAFTGPRDDRGEKSHE